MMEPLAFRVQKVLGQKTLCGEIFLKRYFFYIGCKVNDEYIMQTKKLWSNVILVPIYCGKR